MQAVNFGAYSFFLSSFNIYINTAFCIKTYTNTEGFTTNEFFTMDLLINKFYKVILMKHLFMVLLYIHNQF